MKADAGRRYRLYPDREQAQTLIQWGHTCRALWNLALEQRRFAYQQRGVTLRAYDQCAHLTQARAELPWLAELPAQSAQQVLGHLDWAYDNWWNPAHPAHSPEFKKRRARLAVPFPGPAVLVQRLNRKWGQVRMPKVGWVRFRWSRAPGEVRNATVTVNGSGAWHISFGVHTGLKAAAPNGLPGCGVACSAYVSDEASPRLMAPTLTPGEKARKLGLERRKARQITFANKRNGGTYSRRLRRTLTGLAKLSSRQARRNSTRRHPEVPSPRPAGRRMREPLAGAA